MQCTFGKEMHMNSQNTEFTSYEYCLIRHSILLRSSIASGTILAVIGVITLRMGFPIKAKHLYLLALFQLVGGPVVLLSVIMVGKTVVTTGAQHSLPKALASVLEKETWDEVTIVVAQQANQEPSHPLPDVPVKKTDLKPVIFAIEWTKPGLLVHNRLESAEPPDWLSCFHDLWSKAPPGPPPRWV